MYWNSIKIVGRNQKNVLGRQITPQSLALGKRLPLWDTLGLAKEPKHKRTFDDGRRNQTIIHAKFLTLHFHLAHLLAYYG